MSYPTYFVTSIKLSLKKMSFRNFSGIISTIYQFLIIFIAFYIFIISISIIYKCYVPILFWDEWDDIRHYINFYKGDFHFQELFDQHNEHRLFFPRLIFFADFYFFKATGFPILVLTLIMQILHAIILSLLYRATNPSKNRIFYALPFAMILMLSLGQEDNFISAFQIEFVGVGLASTLAFISFIKALERMKNDRSFWQYELCAYIACVIATFSIANGILSAFIIMIIGISLRSSLSIIFRSFIVFLSLFIGYFWNFHLTPGQGHFLDSLNDPILYFQYFLNYLGNIFSMFLDVSGTWFQTLLGSIGFIATLVGFWRLASGNERNLPRVALLSIALFATGTAMLTSLGRVSLGLAQANDSRYLTPIFIFWIAHIFYWYSLLSEFKKAKYYFIPLHMLSLCIIVAAIQAHIAGLQILKVHTDTLEYAGTALMSEVDAPETFKNLHPSPQRVIEVSSFLRDHGLSIFSTREAKSLGRPITDTYPISNSAACSGSIDQITGQPPNVSPPSWIASGRAWNNLKNKAVDQVILTSQSGTVIGFAASGRHFSILTDTLIGLPESENIWRGFLKADDNEVIVAYALLSNGFACRFGQSKPSLNYLIPVPMDEAGPIIDVPFHAADAWTVNGQWPFIDKLPLNDVIYGSWSGKEKNVGEMVAGPLTIGADPLLIPIVTGPVVNGLSIEIIDTDTGNILAVYTLPVTMNWQLFKFDFSKEFIGKSVNITMSDQGDGWGEWFGVGQFHSSKPGR
jgi:hypothetical protein